MLFYIEKAVNVDLKRCVGGAGDWNGLDYGDDFRRGTMSIQKTIDPVYSSRLNPELRQTEVLQSSSNLSNPN